MLILRADNLQGSVLSHGYFGRRGGTSKGIYASLNCGTGSGDEPDDIAENRGRALGALAGKAGTQLVTCYQIHGTEALHVTEPWQPSNNPKADAMATDRSGIALGILTADCAPILLADEKAHVVGAAHAGWKGAFDGIVESVVRAMVALGASRSTIHAAIGPCIGQPAYEVGPEFEARLRARDPGHQHFFLPSPRTGHWQFDLEGFVAMRLEDAGIGDIVSLKACTYTDEERYFSYRRATHRGEVDYGRQLSAIMLAE
jgi:hypothetical protein